MSERIIVGLSGGVDSAVAALLLKREGWDVVGVFMKNWEEKDDNGVCTSTADYEDVRRVCDVIDIPYYSVNFSKEYMDRVFSYFLDEYSRGRTPNPDILCNTEIKFKAFLEFAQKLGGKLATGHYAQLDKSDGVRLLKGADAGKDQTYFLAGLSQSQLMHAFFPVGGMQKHDVRELARKANIPVAEKKDSTGICFIGERKFREFLKQYLKGAKGDMVTPDGKVVGRHEGLMYYTLGQRRGLGIGGAGERWFVIDKDMENNRLIVEQGETERLFSDGLIAGNISWIAGKKPDKDTFCCKAKFRYRQPDQGVRVKLGDRCRVLFDVPQRAVTPGQWVVFYDGDVCLGGGAIDETFKV